MSHLKGRLFNRKWIGGFLVLLFSGLLHAGTVTYVYTDPQGTVLAEADANGNITARYDYTPYGTAVTSMSGSPNGPGYTGHVNDPDTGLVYMQARYYDPDVGSFLSVDPAMPAAGNVFNFSRYAYANNNPIANTDPDGRCPDKNGCNEAIPYSVFRDNFLGRVASNVFGDPAAVFSPTNTNPLSGDVLNRGQMQDAKLGLATNVLSAIVAPELLVGKSAAGGAAESADVAAGPTLRADIQLSGGRSGSAVKNLTGPADSAVRGSGRRAFVTDEKGRVILDITKDRAKPVTPGQGFGEKRPTTDAEKKLIDDLHQE